MASVKVEIDNNNAYDFEAKIQISRILKILSDTIKNAEVVLCLPLLMANDSIRPSLQHYFKPDQLEFIRDTCKKAFCTVGLGLTLDQPGYEDVEPPFLADMCLVVDLLFSVPEFVNLCRTKIAEGISPGGKALLRNLEELRICVSERLKVTPKIEAQKDAELRRLYLQNMRNKEEFDKLTDKLNKLTTDTEQDIEEKKQFIKQQMDKIAKVRKQCRDNVKKKMDEAERQINWDIKNSEYRMEELQAEAKNAQYRREIQLKEHLNSERDLRSKRYKVESQLVALLQKYDTDIGERQAMLEDLTASYEQETEQMAKLQLQFDEQEAEYMNLMSEKQQYEQQQWEAKLYEIRCRVAARKIQRYYRAYVATTRTKGKKGKKGKKKK